jgi:molybdopterin molybdotransferase
MTPFYDALDIMLAALPNGLPDAQSVSLSQALGRIVSGDISATRDQPPFDASAMDGYACRHSDLPGQLTLVGEAAAGHAFSDMVPHGACVRISTGAPMPSGADCVVMQEAAVVDSTGIALPLVPIGHNIRRAGNDFFDGQVCFKKGHSIMARDVALIAALGLAEVEVFRAPKISIISGGDEIIAAGEKPVGAQIFDSAGPGVAALVQTWGGEIASQTIVADREADMIEAITSASTNSDIIIIIGGASVGPHDHARPSMIALGGEILVSGIAIKPGKPTWFARTEKGLVLGLPGNPAAAMVCARLFLIPLLEAMLGRLNSPHFKTYRARLGAPLPPTKGRMEAFRVGLDCNSNTVTAFNDQDSSLVSVLSVSDGLALRAAHQVSLPSGEEIDLIFWGP